ncbi:TonB-dependent siderophore receptor [Pseudothauera nasutitermitis]|uniref:TonB-dependent siderophore receptor n=1 Tax=Pseudothauera nasutitermitis TaxID=2565930 RepID=A0A4S4B387_9RHOO|nr:TonB-dependent receptor [Pseudothauera nasutitermitis]THF67059.1 TonB-dependent siderophore receptor [Pseudothauera nasutitermitis]
MNPAKPRSARATRVPPQKRPLQRAVCVALLALGGLDGFDVPAAHAQEVQAIRQQFAIPAGPLDDALGAFGAAAGIMVAADPGLTAGIRSSGLSGEYGIEDGLGRLLAGSGLEAVRGQNGGYRLRRLPAASRGEARLAPVTVTAAAERSGTTEGTGSYAQSGPSSTATGLNLTLRETPQTVSVMTRQRIEDEALLGVKDVLNKTPGIKVVEMGPERYTVGSRGYSITNYQLDGVGTHTDVTTQNVFQANTDLVIYDRVEVLRGASGLLTGAGDPSGAINLVRKKPTSEFQAHVAGGIGSWNQRRAEADVSGPLNEAGSLRGRLVAAWQKKDSFVDYHENEKKVLYGVIEADLSDRTRLTVSIDHQISDTVGSWYGIGQPMFFSNGEQTKFSRSKSFSSRDNFSDLKTTNAFLTLEQGLAADWKLKLSANYLHGERDYRTTFLNSMYPFPDKLTGNGLRLDATQGKNKQAQKNLDINLQGSFELFGRQHEAVLGFNYLDYEDLADIEVDTGGVHGTPANIYTWNNRGHGTHYVGSSDSDTFVRQTGFYAAGRFSLSDRLKTIVGVNVYNHRNQYILDNYLYSYYNTTKAKEHGVVTPYAGITYDLTPAHTLYASYTTIYKPQTVQDRTGAMLDPREGANYELGVKSEFLGGRIVGSASVYQIRQDNLAVVDPGHTVPGTTSSAYRAVNGAKTTGVDLEINGEVLRGWNVAASWTYGRTEDDAGKRINTVYPEHLVKLWTTYRLPGALHKLTVGGGVDWQSKTYYTVRPWWVGRNITARQSAYAVANLMARYEISKDLSLTLNVNNLFDKTYLGSLESTFYSGMYGAPRNAQLNVKYSF